MKYNPNTYAPYPVLRPNAFDYPEGEFSTKLKRERRGNELYIECSFNISEPAVLDQVQKGNAACCILVYCLATCYTEVFKATDGNTVLSAFISCDNLKGHVEVHPSVISAENMALPTDYGAPRVCR